MMIKLIFLLLSQTKPRNSKVSRGFTLVEVIVAMLILSIFIVTALTALVSGLNVKLKSKLANEATLIIQQDLEKVRYQAAIYGSPTVSDTPTVISAANPSAVTLTIPVRFTKTISANTELNVGVEKKVRTLVTPYKMTSDSTIGGTSMAVTVELSRLSTASSTTLSEAVSAGATTIKVADTSKIKAGDRIVIGTTSLFTPVVKDYGNSPITGVVNIDTAVPSGGYIKDTSVRVLPRSGDIIDTVTNTDNYAALCKKTVISSCSTNTNPTTIAKCFQTSLGLVSLGSTGTYQAIPSFNERLTYTLKRTVAESQDNATNLSETRLQIVYNVRDTAASPNQDLSTLTAEVIPSVAYQCP